MDFQRATDEELIDAARRARAGDADVYLGVLYRRFYPRVAYWCLRICGDRDEAADLAQEVFLRVHSRIGSFRSDSRFSTWLYTVTRSVAINRGVAARRHRTATTEPPDLPDPSPGPRAAAVEKEKVARVRRVMRTGLEPLEARVLHLHYVNGLTLPAITELLGLENKSGAKALVVSGMRKLRKLLRDEERAPGTAE